MSFSASSSLVLVVLKGISGKHEPPITPITSFFLDSNDLQAVGGQRGVEEVRRRGGKNRVIIWTYLLLTEKHTTN